MQGVEFEEEKELTRSPEKVYFVKSSTFSRNIPRKRMTKSEAQTTVLLILLALLLFSSSGAIFFNSFRKSQLGLVIDPSSISQIEKYRLPENIRAYIN